MKTISYPIRVLIPLVLSVVLAIVVGIILLQRNYSYDNAESAMQTLKENINTMSHVTKEFEIDKGKADKEPIAFLGTPSGVISIALPAQQDLNISYSPLSDFISLDGDTELNLPADKSQALANELFKLRQSTMQQIAKTSQFHFSEDGKQLRIWFPLNSDRNSQTLQSIVQLVKPYAPHLSAKEIESIVNSWDTQSNFEFTDAERVEYVFEFDSSPIDSSEIVRIRRIEYRNNGKSTFSTDGMLLIDLFLQDYEQFVTIALASDSGGNS